MIIEIAANGGVTLIKLSTLTISLAAAAAFIGWKIGEVLVEIWGVILSALFNRGRAWGGKPTSSEDRE